MLDLHRLRLLHELHARGTIAAVADALQFTPVGGVPAARGARARGRRAAAGARRARGSADRRRDRPRGSRRGAAGARRARQADLAAAAGRVPGGAASPRSSRWRSGSPCPRCGRSRARRPSLRCELIEAEPEQSLPALVLGDVDLVLADEWQHQPHARPAGVDREDLRRDPVHLVLPEDHPAARRRRRAVPLAELAGEAWTTGHPGTGWEEIDAAGPAASSGGSTPTSATARTTASPAWRWSPTGQAVTLLPELVGPGAHPGVAVQSDRRGLRAPHDLHGDPRRGRRAALRPGAARGRARRRHRP